MEQFNIRIEASGPAAVTVPPHIPYANRAARRAAASRRSR